VNEEAFRNRIVPAITLFGSYCRPSGTISPWREPGTPRAGSRQKRTPWRRKQKEGRKSKNRRLQIQEPATPTDMAFFWIDQ